MPRLAVYKFLTFFIFGYDALKEKPHVHIAKEKGNRQRSAKIWLHDLKVAEKGTLTTEEINLCIKLITKNQQQLLRSYTAVKQGKKITTIKLSLK